MFVVVVRVCDAGLEDASRTGVSLHFAKVHPAENFASLEDIPKSRWDRSFESEKSAEEDEERKEEKVRKREGSRDLNKKQSIKVNSSERLNIINILNLDVSEASTDEEDDADEKPEAKRLKVELLPKNDGSLTCPSEMAADHRRFVGALIPLPYLEFPRRAMFYSCTVCPAETTFTCLTQFEKHRESDKHRINYGEKFRGNNCQHFPDGAHYSVRVDLNCCYCPARVSKDRFAGLLC